MDAVDQLGDRSFACEEDATEAAAEWLADHDRHCFEVVTVDEQAFEKAGEQAVYEDGFPVVDEMPEFEATVKQETQAKVNANHPDGIAHTSNERIHGVTLKQEERKHLQKGRTERVGVFRVDQHSNGGCRAGVSAQTHPEQ